MLNPIRNTKSKILSFSFLITLLFFSLNTLKKNNSNNFTSLRSLFDQDTAPSVCNIQKNIHLKKMQLD